MELSCLTLAAEVHGDPWLAQTAQTDKVIQLQNTNQNELPDNGTKNPFKHNFINWVYVPVHWQLSEASLEATSTSAPPCHPGKIKWNKLYSVGFI